MAKKMEPKTDPGVLIPAPIEIPKATAQPGEVVIVLADANHNPVREVAIPQGNLGATVIVGSKAGGDRQAYLHVANDAEGRWVFAPTN